MKRPPFDPQTVLASAPNAATEKMVQASFLLRVEMPATFSAVKLKMSLHSFLVSQLELPSATIAQVADDSPVLPPETREHGA